MINLLKASTFPHTKIKQEKYAWVRATRINYLI